MKLTLSSSLLPALLTLSMFKAEAQTSSAGAAALAEQGQSPAARIVPAPGATFTKLALSAKGAQMIIDTIVAHAIKERQALSVAIVDEGGNLLAFKRMDGAQLGTVDAALRKVPTALKLQGSNSRFSSNPSSALAFASAGFTVLGGAQPIKVGDQVIGAVAVSGARDDEYIVVGLAAFKP